MNIIHGDLTFKIRGALYDVFKEMGPGLFESVYERALIIELRSFGSSSCLTTACDGVL